MSFNNAYGKLTSFCVFVLPYQLAIIMVGKQAIGNIVEMVIPAIKKCLKKRDLGVEDANKAAQYERDYALVPNA